MDEKGYTFSPLTFLILIPILVVAINYGSIVNEANMIATIATGGDVTYTTASNVFGAIEKAAADAGRNSAYNATRQVIDDKVFYTDSKTVIKQRILLYLNEHVIENSRNLETQTGREIYINNIPIDNYTNQTFFMENLTITQEDPYGFYVTVDGGIPIKVTQDGQYFEGVTPTISAYVSIEGLEDPYIYLNSKYRTSNIIFKYPYYTTQSSVIDYHFAEYEDKSLYRLYNLWDCLNGTGNPSLISGRPYYFPDPYGLSFFDRLDNKTNQSSTSNTATRMSTFIIGDPLQEDHANLDVSALDHEYFGVVSGYKLGFNKNQLIRDPTGRLFYLSDFYLNYFELSSYKIK